MRLRKGNTVQGGFEDVFKLAIEERAEYIKILSDFNIPMHKFENITKEEERFNYLLDHMHTHIKSLLSSLEELKQAKKQND